MDDKNQNLPADPELEEMDDSDDVEVTREELADSLQAVVSDLSEGLKGTDRDVYTSADDLAQNDWFFAGVSDEDGQYAVTMWPAEGKTTCSASTSATKRPSITSHPAPTWSAP